LHEVNYKNVNMKYTLILFALLLTSYSFSEVGKISTSKSICSKQEKKESTGILFFKGSWQEALDQAKLEKKIIFLDAYAAWCGPCKWMARTTFMDESVGSYFNEHFINVKMDMEKDPEGPRLSKKYKLTAYPTLYFLKPNEEVVSQTMGAYKVRPLLKYAKEVMRLATTN